MSLKHFNDYKLSNEILETIKLLGYEEPTSVQQVTIPLVLEGKDIVIQAKTGSGKTMAFGIPLTELTDWNINKPTTLIISPTRELAVQIKDDLMNIGRFKRLKTEALYGRHSYKVEVNNLKQKTHFVVGTPGRLIDHLENNTLFIDDIKYVVIDEADKLLEMGMFEQLETILEYLPSNRQTMLFSATIPNEVLKLSQSFMNNPLHIKMVDDNEDLKIKQYNYVKENKYQLLKDLLFLKNPDSCLIFCNTKDTVDFIHDRLVNLQVNAVKIHGGLLQKNRLEAIEAFKRGEARYLVATDVASRGIDIDKIDLVINYDIPFNQETYIHRIGRTGRAGNDGVAINIMDDNDIRIMKQIFELNNWEFIISDNPTKNEVLLEKKNFIKKNNKTPIVKQTKDYYLNQSITKLYFNGGSKKKLRPIDFVGTILSLNNINDSDIGIIDIRENVTYIDILNGKGLCVLEQLQSKTIKGKSLKVEIAKINN